MAKKKVDKVVVANEYINACHNLTLNENRIIELAIVDARESVTGLSTDEPLKLSVSRFASVYNISWKLAHEYMLNGAKTLRTKGYELPHPKYPTDPSKNIVTNYIQDYTKWSIDGYFEITFTRSVVNLITRLDGKVTPYTEYVLSQTAKLSSIHAVRLYQLLSAWRRTKADAKSDTPVYEIEKLRFQFNVKDGQYVKTFDFKSKVLDKAIKEINEKTDIFVSYTQVQHEHNRRKIKGFSFHITVKDMKTVNQIEPTSEQDNQKFIFVFKSKKQAKYVASILATLHEIVGNSSYRTTEEATDGITDELLDTEKQQKYIKYIENHDKFEKFKLTKKIISSVD